MDATITMEKKNKKKEKSICLFWDIEEWSCNVFIPPAVC